MLLTANQAFAEMLGHESPSASISTITNLAQQVYAHPKQRTGLIEELIRHNGQLVGFESQYRREDGTAISVNIHARAVRDNPGKSSYIEAFVEDITERKSMEQALCNAYNAMERRVEERTSELAKKTRSLEDVNTALKVLLAQRERDQEALGPAVVSNVKNLISPYLMKLQRSRLTEDQRTFLGLVESHLNEITSHFTANLYERFTGFTPAEIQVADLIRDGKSTKDIAQILCLSEHTIISHRQSIRNKIGLKEIKCSLRDHLRKLAE